jgi:hypothetical protein
MWLQYGLDPTNDFLVSIEYVQRGRTKLLCPYCRGELTAKKGNVLAHHFAHAGETCRSAARSDQDLPTLPLYDKFDLHLSSKAFAQLAHLWKKSNHGEDSLWFFASDEVPHLKQLWREGLLTKSPGRTTYRFTDLGKIPFGALPLKEFNAIQEPKILKRWLLLDTVVQERFRLQRVTLPEVLVDLKIYCAQLRRILALSLYFLQVEADGQTFYKIGVTSRPMEERLSEIEAELRKHFDSVKLKVRGTWAHRGNLELCFKHRYKLFQYTIGNLTEYYLFDGNQVKAVLADLRRVKPKVLSDSEARILAGQPSPIEEQIEAERQAYFAQIQEQQRSLAIRTGMKRAKQWGIHVGRPRGVEESPEQFLSKPSTQRVLQVLEQGLSLRETAQEAGVSVNTVRKIKAMFSK